MFSFHHSKPPFKNYTLFVGHICRSLNTHYSVSFSLILFPPFRQYASDKSEQLVERVKAGGLAGHDMLNPALKASQVHLCRRVDLEDEGPIGREAGGGCLGPVPYVLSAGRLAVHLPRCIAYAKRVAMEAEGVISKR